MLIILIYYLNITRESQLKKDLKKLMFKRYLKKKKEKNKKYEFSDETKFARFKIFK